LTCINPQTGRFSRFYEYDGLQGNEFRINALYKNNRGQLFFGGTKGLTSFYPQVVNQKLHDVPPVIFTRLTVANREVEYDDTEDDNILDKHITEATRIVLPYSTNSFSLGFSVPEFTNPQRIRYTYLLSRFDNEWKTASPDNRTATYTNLPHGRYTMTVRASFDGDEENASEHSIEVRVLPPWWLSFWAFLIYLGLAAVAAFLAYALHRKSIEHKQAQEASAIKEAKLQTFTDISHEIRTPLNLVISPLRKLIETETDPAHKESYEMMYRNASIILDKMNDFEEDRRRELAADEPGMEEESYLPPEDTESKFLKSRKNLLLVDENAEMCRYLKMELQKTFNVETCTDADEAWKKVVSTLPDAVVTDIITGGSMDGTGLCEKIKRNPSSNLIPVLILTSQWDEETIRRCTESGADRYLVKPVSVALLRSTVQKAISTRETIRNKYTNEVPYDYDSITIPNADDHFLSRTIETIKEHISDPSFGVEELSREIGMSRVHLNRRLKETISVSPGTFIKSIRLKQAAYLLVNNKVNISEVAFKVGFSTHSYFSSTFKEYFGLSPKDFVVKYSDPARKEELDKLLEI
jgi:AraC-like DNA-binding protein